MFSRDALIFYGMYRMTSYRDLLPFKKIDQTDWNWDNMFILSVMARGRVEYVDRTLFDFRLKDRSFREADWPRPGLEQYLSQSAHELRIGQAIWRIIGQGNFSFWERMVLRLFVPINSMYFTLVKWPIGYVKTLPWVKWVRGFLEKNPRKDFMEGGT